MDELENENRLTKVEESVKSAHHRIDKLETVQTEIHTLAMSVSELASSVKTLCKEVCDIAARVKYIEDKPAKRWDQLIGYVLAAIASGVIGYFIRSAFQ